MMRALFAGVSGLSNNQLKMDIIGNNIANINTIGFKTSRINFAEELSQLIQSSTESASGGTKNALFVGLGVRANSIERDFSQGILQTTGKQTDLGIEGDGFFVLSDGNTQLYTRAGNMHFDGNGRLVNANGLTVQGWTADLKGDLSATAQLGNITFDASVISPAISTQNLAIAGNLDATATPVREEWTANQTFTVAGAPAVGADTLNSLTQTTTPLVDGDIININGTNSDGSVVSATFTYGAANDGTTIDGLLASISASFNGAATLVNGSIVLNDLAFGESQTTITLSADPGNTGVIDLPGFVNTAKGFSPQTSSSVEVYDSLGSKHTLNVTFTKTENAREWTFKVGFSGNEVINEGSTGTITFKPTGSLDTIVYDNGQPLLNFSPGNGADDVIINLDFENSTGFSGVTQFAGQSSVLMPYQDGQAHGTLSAFSIDERGRLVGAFTNGRSRTIAQIALAKINNPEGLTHIGNNIYRTSGTTGIPSIGKAGEDLPASIFSGTLEASNVDLAAEFTDMIIAQRAFQANARVITVSDQFLSEVTQLKR
ncbi:flagellar hook-basal body complex protein [candidate division KSB1 bacterium]|nr:flagellar hook-basal body complex protein [candidate division KSB1 bacterium]